MPLPAKANRCGNTGNHPLNNATVMQPPTPRHIPLDQPSGQVTLSFTVGLCSPNSFATKSVLLVSAPKGESSRYTQILSRRDWPPRLASRKEMLAENGLCRPGRTVAGAVWGSAFESVLNCELSAIHWSLHQLAEYRVRARRALCGLDNGPAQTLSRDGRGLMHL